MQTAVDPRRSYLNLPAELPNGLIYQPDFLSEREENELLAEIRRLPLNEARFQQYTARRRVVRYGEGDYPASYGAAAENVEPPATVPGISSPVCDAKWPLGEVCLNWISFTRW